MTQKPNRQLHAVLFLLLSALPLIWPTPGNAQASAPAGSLSVETSPYPSGVARPSAEVSYAAPAFAALRQTVAHEGKQRHYYLHAPDTDAQNPRAVVVLLHGANRSGRSMIEIWRATADRHDFMLVAPDSLGQSWSPANDSPNFLIAALSDAHGKFAIDPRRIYLFGHSAGGILATFYANRLGVPWWAVATHGGVLEAAQVVAAETAPPMRHYLGLSDHLFSGRAAQATAKALSEAGHDVELVMVRGHTHWYYAVGPYLSEETWQHWQSLDRAASPAPAD